MAFWSVCEEEEIERISSCDLKEWFTGYCEWCWGHGFGNCNECRKYKNHLLYMCKMKEFKQRKQGDVS